MPSFEERVQSWIEAAQKMGPARLAQIIVPLVIVVIAVGVLVRQEMNYVVASPCAPDQMPGRCYRIPQKTCELLWAQTEGSCRGAIQKLSLAPGQLAGSMLHKCQIARMDQVISYSRVSTEECEETARELKEWANRNPDLVPPKQ